MYSGSGISSRQFDLAALKCSNCLNNNGNCELLRATGILVILLFMLLYVFFCCCIPTHCWVSVCVSDILIWNKKTKLFLNRGWVGKIKGLAY